MRTVEMVPIVLMVPWAVLKMRDLVARRRRPRVAALDPGQRQLSRAECAWMHAAMVEVMDRPARQRERAAKEMFRERGYRVRVWSEQGGHRLNVQVLGRVEGANFPHVPEWHQPEQPQWWTSL